MDFGSISWSAHAFVLIANSAVNKDETITYNWLAFFVFPSNFFVFGSMMQLSILICQIDLPVYACISHLNIMISYWLISLQTFKSQSKRKEKTIPITATNEEKTNKGMKNDEEKNQILLWKRRRRETTFCRANRTKAKRSNFFIINKYPFPLIGWYKHFTSAIFDCSIGFRFSLVCISQLLINPKREWERADSMETAHKTLLYCRRAKHKNMGFWTLFYTLLITSTNTHRAHSFNRRWNKIKKNNSRVKQKKE